MPNRTTYRWFGFYHHHNPDKPATVDEIRDIPQFGELWRIPDTCVYNIEGRYHQFVYKFQPGECVIGTGVWKNIGCGKHNNWSGMASMIKIKVMLMTGRPVWIKSTDAGCFVKIADCPQ